MIHVDIRTGDHACDNCGATLALDAGERAYNAFLLAHGQCRKPSKAKVLVIAQEPPE